MASNRKDKKQVSDLSIFEQEKRIKVSAKKALEIAKGQETKKLNQGYFYKPSIDGKTFVLTNKVYSYGKVFIRTSNM